MSSKAAKHQINGVNEGKRDIELSYALNHAAVHLHHPEFSTDDVLSELFKQLVELHLEGLVALLDDPGEYKSVHTIRVYSSGYDDHKQQAEIIPQAEIGSQTDLNVNQNTIPYTRVDVFEELIQKGETVFLENGQDVISQIFSQATDLASDEFPKANADQAVIVTPLRTDQCIIGFLIVYGETLAEIDTQAFELIGEHLQIALENADNNTSLKQAKSRYHMLIEALNDAVFLETLQGQMIDCNSAACKMFGYTKEEILQLSVSHLVSDEVIPPLETGVDYPHPSSILLSRRRDGSSFPVEISLRPVMVGSEQLLATYIRDISVRKEIEDILLGMESVLCRQTEELSAIYDVSLNITEANDLPALLETIVEQGVQLLSATGGRFYICDSNSEQVECVVSHRTKRDFKGTVSKYGEGLAGKVAQSGQPMIIDGYHNWTGRETADEDDEPFRSVISAPVFWQGRVTGVLHVLDDTGQRLFTQTELRTLTLLANQAAVAIENARLIEGERRRRQEAETLRNASNALVSTLDLQEVLDNILVRLSEVIPYDSATVFLHEGDSLHGEAARGIPSPESIIGNCFPADDPFIQEIRRTGEPLVLEDAQMHPDFKCWGETVYVRGWMGVPLVSKDEVIGYLTCDSKQPTAYKPADATLAQAFANQAATVIENARLFEAKRSELLLSQTLQEVGALLTTQLSLDEVLETIIDLLGRVVSYDSASIQLLDPYGKLILAAGRGFAEIETTHQVVSDLSDHMLASKLSERAVMVIPDTYNDSRWRVIPHTEYIRSWVGAPLLVKGRLIGCLNVDSQTINAYDERTGNTVMAFAHQAAIAIENARLFERVVIEQRHLRLLYDLNLVTTSSLNPDDILQSAITLTTKALDGLIGQAYTYTPTEDFLRLGAFYRRSDDLLPAIDGEFKLPLGVGLIGWVAQKRKSASAPDVTQDSRWKFYPGMDDGVMSALCAPILAGDRFFGVFSIFHHQTKAFSDEHMILLEAICQAVGLALSNAQRYQQIQRLSNILQSQQRQLENLVEHMPVGVLLLDTNLRVLVMNPLGSVMLETSNGEEIKVSDTIDRIGPVALQELVDRSDEALPLEFSLEEYPKEIFAVQMRAADGSNGNPEGRWVLTINDITQERENLAQIQAQERLATVGQLAAGIAHDFNNIMATILVYTDLMNMDTSIQPASQDKLDTIKHQIQRASSLIRQILDFSRRSVMDQSTMDLLPLVKELDKILARTLPETIQVELSYEPENYWINGDPTRLQQVFMNLALNARDAMPDGGTLKISLLHTHLPPSLAPPTADISPGKWVLITVTDTGIGIPPELREHIFEPFFTTKSIDQGTGLGLAQVYGIVKQHDGFIDFESGVGTGTSFAIYLPALSVKAEQDPRPETGPLVDGHGFSVLVVEDDRFTREALKELLRAYDFRVQLASNGVEALQLLENMDLIDLVISDIVMPKMGGLDLYKALEKDYPAIKVLLITGHPIEEESHLRLEKGNIHWLQKPFTAHEFKEIIAELLEISPN